MKDHIPGGFVVLSRQIVNSSLWKMKPNDLKLAIYLLTTANWQDTKWHDEYQHKEIIIKRGEIRGTIREFSKGSRLSIRETRSALKRLLQHGFIKDVTPKVVKRAHGYTYLVICKYEHYQDIRNYVGAELTHDRHTGDTRPTHDRHTSLNKDKHLKQVKQKTPCQDVVNLWNSICTNLPKIRTLGAQRRQNILNRLKEHPELSDWQVVFEWLNQSPHHTGNNKRKWIATIDFIIERGKGAKFNEILEKATHQSDSQNSEDDSDAEPEVNFEGFA